MAEPTRRRLLDLSAADGEASATTLGERLPVTRQTVVKHLAVCDATGWFPAPRWNKGRGTRRLT
ncbi:ArsR/SmtB family transcription factor [Nonomuraea sp. NPDC048826]|uniref:ArsR/SmtB family transcription factor n=1 Tax=Nonomuraea sp. NPDC048826 TaxID=3364347 RepID=UPI00371969A8